MGEFVRDLLDLAQRAQAITPKELAVAVRPDQVDPILAAGGVLVDLLVDFRSAVRARAQRKLSVVAVAA